ncbi:hypothetical protein, partial [Nocardioides sp.]|uniref:hypothetical protein n=1 Tax=Nocardioides sp. TaxID=35761 RepID=UPI003564F811
GLSTIVLRRHLGSISVATGTGWSGFALRVLVTVAVATAVAGGVRLLLPDPPADSSVLRALLELGLVGAAAVAAYLVVARLVRLTEVTSVLDTLLRRRTA